jgi:hypothetical protein
MPVDPLRSVEAPLRSAPSTLTSTRRPVQRQPFDEEEHVGTHPSEDSAVPVVRRGLLVSGAVAKFFGQTNSSSCQNQPLLEGRLALALALA